MTELEKDIYIQLLETYIIELEWQEKLDQLNKMMEDAIKDHQHQKFPPQTPPYVHPIPLPATWNKTCPSCGLKLDGPMGYVCPNSRCPSGLGNVFVD